MAGDKLQMFGKTYNKVGDNSANLCLYTAGDVMVKTPGRFITLFKNGKLNVPETGREEAAAEGRAPAPVRVSSVDEITGDGLYVVPSVVNGGTVTNVYLRTDGESVLLGGCECAGEYVSYGGEQELKPEQFLQALRNIGFYFDSVDAVSEAGFTDGLVYVLAEHSVYNVVHGVPHKFPDEVSGIGDWLRVGDIFVDGRSNYINSDGSLAIKVSGANYFVMRDGRIYPKKDMCISRAAGVYTEGGVRGESGFLLYTDDGETVLETDRLVIHGGVPWVDPRLQESYVSSDVRNMVSGVSLADDGLVLGLKYTCGFSRGDLVAVYLATGNRVSFDYVRDESGHYLKAETEFAPGVATKFYVTYKTASYGDGGTVDEVDHRVDMDIDPVDSGNRFGLAGIDVPDDSWYVGVSGVEIHEGDMTVYYDDSGKTVPVLYYGTVLGLDPFTVTLPDNASESMLDGIVGSVVCRVAPKNGAGHMLMLDGDTLSVVETVTDGAGGMAQSVRSRVGDLVDIGRPGGAGNFDGVGVYSDSLHAVSPEFYGGVFEGAAGDEYPRYGGGLEMPATGFSSAEYDKVIPDIKWVKALLQPISGDIGDVLTHYATKDYVDAGDAGKVDKVDGKGLSSNDFTDAYREKLDDLVYAEIVGVNIDVEEDIGAGRVTLGLPQATDVALGGVYVDTSLNDTSENPVQNKAVKNYVDTRFADMPHNMVVPLCGNDMVITHSFGYNPSVTVVCGLNEIIASVEYVSATQVRIVLNSPVELSGWIYLV